MKKKVIDILPPEKVERKKIIIEPERKNKSERRVPGAFLIIFLVLLAGGIFVHITLSKAEIEILPETEKVTYNINLTIDTATESLNLLDQTIPGKIFTEEKTFFQEFSATGKKFTEKKAEGIIRIFNDSQNEQTLIPQTRFQAPLEKFQPPLEGEEKPWFRIQEKVVIPAKSYKDAKVIADSPGEKYNIGPSTFSIPGLAGTPQYTLVYGQSFEPMAGGTKKEIPEVTEEDLKEAERILKEKAFKEMTEILKEKADADFIILEETVKTEILEVSSLAQVKSSVEKFPFEVKAQIKAIAFKKDDLENFSNQLISGQIPIDKKISPESLKLDYSLENFDFGKKKAIISLALEAEIYSPIEEIILKKAVAGKTLTETEFLLENQPEIKEVTIKLSPPWLKKVPEDIEKIEIKLNFD